MLFSSFDFIFFFLPTTFSVFFLLGSVDLKRYAALSLVAASLFFYAYWNANYLPLLLISILVNFYFGRLLSPSNGRPQATRKLFLIVGVSLNLLTLGYFKYTGFILKTLSVLVSTQWQITDIILPLAISFFTITQIAYLVDAYSGEGEEYSLLEYMLFVTTFQHLIAGPIVHHKSLAPQFQADTFFRLNISNVSIGLTFFTIGLAKKILIADQMMPYTDAAFGLVAQGAVPFFWEAWLGILAFIVQIYYDFSGYSEMAIGLGLMFNLRLPVNFASPYQAVNISDLWRRWHITLSQFLREYLFTPLALLAVRKDRLWGVYPALMLTMVLAGLWHGAGQNFVLFGVLMGIYICIHYAWQSVSRNWIKKSTSTRQALCQKIASRTLTFFCVIIAWVIFRADTPTSAWLYFQGMFSSESNLLKVHPAFYFALNNGGSIYSAYCKVLTWIAVVLFLPNMLWWMAQHETQLELDTKLNPVPASRYKFLQWQPNVFWGIITGMLTVLAFIGMGTKTVNFIYFQF